MENEYVAIVDYYDNLPAGEYRNFTRMANALHGILGSRRKILDIGIGTGLMAEQLLKLGDYEITGVDFSPRMLRIAQQRLAGKGVTLHCQDVARFETEERYDAIISTGGAIYIVEEEKEYRLYSHLTTQEANLRLLRKLHTQLQPDGVLALGIEGPHTNDKQPMDGGILYEQRVKRYPAHLDKWHTFSRGWGPALAEQFCRFHFWHGMKTMTELNGAGFTLASPHREGHFLVLDRMAASHPLLYNSIPIYEYAEG